MTEQDKQQAMRTVGIIHSATLVVDAIDLTAIFYMVGSEALKLIFEQITRYFMLPVAVIANMIFAGLAIRQAVINKGEGYFVLKAVTETIGAVAIATAVIGGLITASIAAFAAPAIFAATFGMKILVNIGSSIYFGVMAAKTDDPVKKFEYRKKAIENGVGAVIGTILTTAVIAVMLLAKPAMFILGIIGGAMLTAVAALKGIELLNQKPAAPAAAAPTAALTNNAELARNLGVSRDPSQKQELQSEAQPLLDTTEEAAGSEKKQSRKDDPSYRSPSPSRK